MYHQEDGVNSQLIVKPKTREILLMNRINHIMPRISSYLFQILYTKFQSVGKIMKYFEN